MGSAGGRRADEGDRAGHLLEPLRDRPRILLGAGVVEVLGQRPADPALDRADEVGPARPMNSRIDSSTLVGWPRAVR